MKMIENIKTKTSQSLQKITNKKLNLDRIKYLGLFSGCNNPLDDVVNCVQSVSKDILVLILGGVTIYSIFVLPYMGFLMASGSPENIKKGKEMFTAWITGIVLIIFSGLIVRVVAKDLLGVG